MPHSFAQFLSKFILSANLSLPGITGHLHHICCDTLPCCAFNTGNSTDGGALCASRVVNGDLCRVIQFLVVQHVPCTLCPENGFALWGCIALEGAGGDITLTHHGIHDLESLLSRHEEKSRSANAQDALTRREECD